MASLLLLPGLGVYALLFLGPMAVLLAESFRLFIPGQISAGDDAPSTLANYAALFDSGFLRFFYETFRISLVTTLVGLTIAFPVAYWIAMRLGRRARTVAITMLVTFLFLSVVVRTYALELTFGAVSPLRPAMDVIGLSPNSRTYIEFLVGAGLLQFIVPMSVLTLVGTLQNFRTELVEAAKSLGAPAWKVHWLITLPLSMQGMLSAFLLGFSFAISAFVVPLILGKGRVLFLSNLIYNRFSEIANYPGGAAISVVTLVVSLAIVYLISRLLTTRLRRSNLA